MARIAFYAPLKPPDHPVPSGDRSMARALVAALRLAGHEVEIASRLRSFDRGDPQRQQRLAGLGGRLAARLVRRYAQGARPDLWFTYHLYQKAPDWIGPAVAERLGIPYLLAEASYAPKQAGGAWDAGHRASAGAIGRAARIFQFNPIDSECVRPLLGPDAELVAIPPFLDRAPFRAAETRGEARALVAAELDLDPETPWLLAVAMMRSDQKLQSYLCLAQALSGLADLPWQLVISGAGPAEATVRAAFSEFGPRIRWIGLLERPRLICLYRAADLFVWPALKEAWGMALLEAQTAGLPVVAGRSPGVATIVADGETGLLPEQGDAAAFAHAVRALLADAGSRERMRCAALERTAHDHDIAAAAALLDAHIRAATGSGR